MPGLDPRDVQDVVDHGPQIAPGLVDHLGLAPLPGIQTAGLGGQHLREQQDRVQRRAQLMADVGQELRLVAVGFFQLAGMGLRGLQVLGMGLRQGGELLAELADLPRPAPTEAQRPTVAQDLSDAAPQLLAEMLGTRRDPARQDHDHQAPAGR
jgi:hypothetical protein